MRSEAFGLVPAGPVHRLVLGAEPGPVLHVLTLGATAHRLELTCGDGVRRDVLLGHATPEEYLASTAYIGASVGRYANRIAGGRFELDGRVVQVGVHDRGNHLHGGPDGFDRRLWQVLEHEPARAVLGLRSPDGDQGFPGNLEVEVEYVVGPAGVDLTYRARTDAATVVNLTNHAYFNLDGDGAGVIDDHLLGVHADAYTPVDGTGIPLVGWEPVGDTPFDLRTAARLGDVVRSGHPQVGLATGIDHNFVLLGSGMRETAALTSTRSLTRLVLSTDQPGLQVYTGNFLDGSLRSRHGRAYRQGDGIALEPQVFPDSPNQPGFPSAVLRPGQEYRSRIGWRFERHDGRG